jgi:hypothetical protein
MTDDRTIQQVDDLHTAIMGNSRTLVRHYLSQGGINPNATPNLPNLLDLIEDSCSGIVDISSIRVACYGDEDYQFTALHSAVVNCYHSSGTPYEALIILSDLLMTGASTTALTSNVAVCHLQTCGWLKVHGMTPLALAATLKRNVAKNTSYAERTCQALDTAISMMIDSEYFMQEKGNEEKSSKKRYREQQIIMSESTRGTWESLLFSEMCSDVHFVCADEGLIVHAHKAILSAASPYFHRYFEGPWGDLQEQLGQWITENTSKVMKPALRFMYTGCVKESEIESDEDARALLSLAVEYELPNLKSAVEIICSRRLAPSNIKDFLLIADLLDAFSLKDACFVYLRDQMAQVMFSEPDFAQLASTDPQLWGELKENIAPAAISLPPCKRARVLV